MGKNNAAKKSDQESDTIVPQSELANQLTEKEMEQGALLCVAGRIAAARTRTDLWDIINSDILNLFGGSYYALRLLNDDGATHFPFLYSRDSGFDQGVNNNIVQYQQHPIDDGIFNKALTSRSPIVFTVDFLVQNGGAPTYIHHLAKWGIVEMLVIKIANGNEDKGVLYLFTNKKNAFLTAKFNLFAGVADLLGAGICNVLASEKIERQIQEIDQYKQRLEEEKSYLMEEQRFGSEFTNVVGNSEEIQKVFRLVSQVASSDSTVLLLGETGTGKELVARAIHESSPRKDKLMIKVNCAAMPANLI